MEKIHGIESWWIKDVVLNILSNLYEKKEDKVWNEYLVSGLKNKIFQQSKVYKYISYFEMIWSSPICQWYSIIVAIFNINL